MVHTAGQRLVGILLVLLLGNVSSYRLGLAVKSSDNAFFHLAEQGCLDRASEGNHTCIYGGPLSTANNSGVMQAILLEEMLDEVDAVAVSVRDGVTIAPVFDIALERGIPVITFDSDAPASRRITYIGTDNYFLGESLAKAAKQISPEGGTYGVVYADESPNILERVRGFKDEIELVNSKTNIIWREVDDPPPSFNNDAEVAVEMMETLAEQNTTVICGVDAGAMWSDNYESFYNRNRFRGLTIVVADDLPRQIDLLSRGKGQGLVGQMPYEMGYIATDTLIKLLDGQTDTPEIIGTNLITHLQVPLVLPALVVNTNLIGNLNVVGYVLFGAVALASGVAVVWTIRSRKQQVVEAAQPPFLLLVAFGVLFMGAVMVPLSLDDRGDPDSISPLTGKAYCMSIPWLCFCGFTIVFSALFSKLIRVNRIVHASNRLVRVKVTVQDVLAPFAILLLLNIALLLIWSFVDPLTYVRTANPGTDGWNRIISTYGACRSRRVELFLIPLALVNLGVLVLANHQAYLARRIKSEFAESKYIAASMVSLLQAVITGVPILFVVKNSPQAFYLVMVFMMFAICMGVLLMIFIPKMLLAKKFMKRTEQSQRQVLSRAIRQSVYLGATSGGERSGGMTTETKLRRNAQRLQDGTTSTNEVDEATSNAWLDAQFSESPQLSESSSSR